MMKFWSKGSKLKKEPKISTKEKMNNFIHSCRRWKWYNAPVKTIWFSVISIHALYWIKLLRYEEYSHLLWVTGLMGIIITIWKDEALQKRKKMENDPKHIKRHY